MNADSLLPWVPCKDWPGVPGEQEVKRLVSVVGCKRYPGTGTGRAEPERKGCRGCTKPSGRGQPRLKVNFNHSLLQWLYFNIINNKKYVI